MLRLLRSRAPQIRSFTQSPFLAARGSRKAPTTRTPVTESLSRTRNPIQPPAPKTNAKGAPPSPPSNAIALRGYANGLLGDAESLLLYKAPSGTAIFATSVIAGSGIFLWVKYVANGVFMEWSAPWYAKLVVLAGCLMSSAMGAAIILTPHRLIRSISLVRTADQKAVLRVKGTTFLPFMKPKVMDVAPGELMIDSNASFVTGRPWYTIPMKNSKQWTDGELTRPDAITGNAFQRFNQHMLRVGPTTFSLVRKMFNRDAMIYARVGDKNWKMDLESCEVLERGQTLAKFTREGAVRTSLAGMLSQSIGSKL